MARIRIDLSKPCSKELQDGVLATHLASEEYFNRGRTKDGPHDIAIQNHKQRTGRVYLSEYGKNRIREQNPVGS